MQRWASPRLASSRRFTFEEGSRAAGSRFVQLTDHALRLYERAADERYDASRRPQANGEFYGPEPFLIAAADQAGRKATADQRHGCHERRSFVAQHAVVRRQGGRSATWKGRL